MATHLTEEEQIESLKRWWNENGKFTIIVVLAAIAGYFGWQAWSKHQVQQKQEASGLYQSLLDVSTLAPGETLDDDKYNRAISLGKQLQEGYSGSYYSVAGALMVAKLEVEKGSLDSAITYLEWAKNNNDDKELDIVIDPRLARLYVAKEKFDDALALVTKAPQAAATSSYAELRGDIYAAKGDSAKSSESYQLALDTLSDQQSNRRRFIEMKLSEQAVSSSSVAEAE